MAGLVCEILVVAFLHGTGRREMTASIVSVAIIILGVGLENFAGNKADGIVRVMRAPRSLNSKQLARIAAAISGFQNTPYDAAVDENTEPRHLLGEILTALNAAHWNRRPWGGPGTGLAIYVDGIPIAFAPLDGVQVAYDPSQEQDFGAPANALASALSKEGIPTNVVTNAVTRAEQIRLFVGVKP
jgi:hypothetical protein